MNLSWAAALLATLLLVGSTTASPAKAQEERKETVAPTLAEPGSLDSPTMTPQGTTRGERLRIGATVSDTGALADVGIQVRRGLVMWQAKPLVYFDRLAG